MNDPQEIEDRLKVLEEFVTEVKSGQRVLLWICGAVGGVLASVYFALNIWKGLHG